MKHNISFNQDFERILEIVGKTNNISKGKALRLIVESQLTYYEQSGKIPFFIQGVFIKNDKQTEIKKIENSIDPETIRIAKTKIW